jgi:CRP/FNR family putative post-exponential-phase nitrogen-starvation transcriptional regulator
MHKQKLPANYSESLTGYGLNDMDLSGASLMRFDPGEWFILAGRELEYLYVLLSGKAKVCISEPDGRSLLLSYYVSEGVLGELELLLGKPEAITSVQALTPLLCIGLPLGQYTQELLHHLPFVLCIARGCAQKLCVSVTSTTEIILRPFEARLCAYLLQSAQGGVFFERLTDVSEQLGVSYRHLLRSLKKLCENGLLEKRADGYHILDDANLRKKAAG